MSESPSGAVPSTTDQTGQDFNSTGPSNVTSAQAGSNNATSMATSYIAASTSHDQGSHSAGTVVALTLILVAISAAIIFGFLYLKRKRKLPTTLSCWKPSRKSSISGSRRALAELDDMETTVRSRQSADNTDDMFTIEDFDDNTDPQGGRQEYFYDEVFGQSQFEDETTNNAMRNLYSDHNSLTQEEMLNIDNEIQGAYIHDFIPDSDNKRFA